MLIRLVLAISGLFGTVRRRSALPLKADVAAVGRESPKLTRPGHSAQVKSDPEGPIQTSEMARLGSRNSLLPTLAPVNLGCPLSRRDRPL
jgi:hypothetical protein